jgi:hypothetical protein
MQLQGEPPPDRNWKAEIMRKLNEKYEDTRNER